MKLVRDVVEVSENNERNVIRREKTKKHVYFMNKVW